MKKLLAVIILTVSYVLSFAQPIRNEWIDYSKTYYKFKISSDGIYRITQNQLATIGLGGTNAQDFKLWRNGVEIPLFTSSNSGPLVSNGYIEFIGKKNDGVPDTDLYPSESWQPNTAFSLYTDEAIYFLTVSAGTTNLRFAGMANNLTNPGTPEPYCLYTARQDYRDQLWGGNASPIQGEQVRSSTYDKGEGFQSNPFDSSTQGMYTYFFGLKYAPGSPVMKISYKGAGNFIGGRTVKATINDSVISSSYVASFDTYSATVDGLTGSIVENDNTIIQFSTSGNSIYEKALLSYAELTYGRQLDFSGMDQVTFRLPSNSNGAYLEISNFNAGGQDPILYDLTSNQRYVCEVADGVLKVKLQPSTTEHSFALLSASAIASVNGFTSRNFVNYGTAANQGNYLIIANKTFTNSSNNQVEAYKNYRSSVAGGGYNAIVVDIDEITDQFAYGISMHPTSIRNFLRYARASFASAPQYVLLIGHGLTYVDYANSYWSGGTRDALLQIPTWGSPGSDNLLSATNDSDPNVLTPIGRISAINNTELQQYLTKVIQYEQLQTSNATTQTGQDWKKKVLHLIGANDDQTRLLIEPMMDRYKDTAQAFQMGADVHTYVRAGNPNITQDIAAIANLINNGVPLLTYFGHSSSTSLDFNLNNPADYSNTNGKYPVFIANGCNAGNFFAFDANRLNGINYTISEKFLLAPERGSIAFIASTHFGVLNTLDYLTESWYVAASKTNYGQSLGKLQQKAIETTWNRNNGDFHTKLTLEETTLNGDPAVKLFSFSKPDYSLEPQNLSVNPGFITTADSGLTLKIVPFNIGKSLDQPVTIRVERKLANGTIRQTINRTLSVLPYTDTVEINIPVIGNIEKGQNTITVTIDPENQIEENSESNNTASIDFTISTDEIRPIYPYEYSIVNTPSVKLTSSTVDPLEASRNYRIQIDTTENFNSSGLITNDVTSAGGVVEYNTSGLTNGKVYYWRVAPVVNETATNWRSSSFLYNTSLSLGFNQSHLYQHLKSSYDKIFLNPATRQLTYAEHLNNLFITHSKYPESGTEDNHFSIVVNGDALIQSACYGYSIIFNVFDTATFIPWKNPSGMYGSVMNCNTTTRSYNFEFPILTPSDRKKVMDFMDALPSGMYVTARNIIAPDPNNGNFNYMLPNTWKADTSLYGSGKSLYHYFLNQGIITDNVNDPSGRIWAVIYRKNNQDRFQSKFYYSQGIYDRVVASINCPTYDTVGYITSPKFGPAKAWQSVQWSGHSVETSNAPDSVSLSVIGIDKSGKETVISTHNNTQLDFNISGVNASDFPYLKLKLRNQDAVHASPWQLDFWRINYTPIPEGAIAPNLYYTGGDSTKVDSVLLSKYSFGVAFKNVSNVSFDSLKVQLQLTDSLGKISNIVLPKIKPIAAGDTAKVYFELSTDTLSGPYNMMVNINPDNADPQPEQVHFNNFIYKSIVVLRSTDIGICPGSNITYKSNLNGSNYHWQVNTGNGYEDVLDNSVYLGSASSNLVLSSPPTSWYGYKFRCRAVVNGLTTFGSEYTLKFASKWNGTKDTQWENTANWSCGSLPDEYTDVIINSILNQYPVVNSPAACRSIKALPNATIRVKAGYELKVTGK